ncbi:MAG: endopeptidase La [Oligoflexia bacterium]|nr:endopeptidase La [Oligoflexia bacterium]
MTFDDKALEIPETMPMLPVRDIVVFPYMILPLFVGREPSIKAVEDALAKNRLIFLASQKELTEENPSPESIYEVGTIAMIMRMRKLADGRVKILIQGVAKGRVEKFTQTAPSFIVKVKKIDENALSAPSIEIEAMIRNVKEHLEKIISLGKMLSPDILMVLDDVGDPGRLADLVASNLGLKVQEAQAILETLDHKERLRRVNDLLVKELELLAMQARIRSQAKDEMTRSQKEYFLREQIRAIKSELGEQDTKSEEIDELREKVEACHMPEHAEKEALKQLSRLERMHPDASEATMVRTYIDWLVDLPWSKNTADNFDLQRAKEILDEDHFDLRKIKDRILEFMAVRKLKSRMKGPILCFVGPPGVGKTSLGKSIARSMGREFVRISLGGVKDEAEIRGHRRTYVGAMPGRIVQGLKQAQTNNPIFILDEIDKLGSDFRGDPSSAMLEVLDPEQNHSFRDHYINIDFDLSNVMFLATANVLETIPQALRDRMEIIQLSGYSEEEKLIIARKYLIKKQMEENGVTDKNIEFKDEGTKRIIGGYTREAGLRNLEREIGSVCRKIARGVAEGSTEKTIINQKSVEKLLGPPKYIREDELERNEIGVTTGLAWTQFGGEILYIEASKMKGKGGLTLTGQLGDVMKESATAAMSFARAHAKDLGISEDYFAEHDIHVHIPAGAIPKDGPSAGITLATSIISLLTDNPVRKDVAMTGELTLLGKVLPIGGLKEKSLAAMRQGVKDVIIPFRNVKDLEEIPEEFRKKLNFIPVKNLSEVLAVALEKKITSLKTAGQDPGSTIGSRGAKQRKGRLVAGAA